MATASKEPSNPLYYLLLLICLLFVLTALAYAVVPVLEQKAMDAGELPPPSPFRDSLRNDGWKWILAEMAAIVLVGLACMGWDRFRQKQIESQPEVKIDPLTADIEIPKK